MTFIILIFLTILIDTKFIWAVKAQAVVNHTLSHKNYCLNACAKSENCLSYER